MKMQNTEMEFVAFDAQDVIATSGGGGDPTLKLSGYYDGIEGNLEVIFNGVSYKAKDRNEFLTAMSSYSTQLYCNGLFFNVKDFLAETPGPGYENVDTSISDEEKAKRNGVYDWIVSEKFWVHQQ